MTVERGIIPARDLLPSSLTDSARATTATTAAALVQPGAAPPADLEARLRHAEARYRALFDDAPVKYVVLSAADADACIVDCNRRFLATVGYQREDVVGHALAEFCDPATWPALHAALAAIGATGDDPPEIESRLLTRHASAVDVLVRFDHDPIDASIRLAMIDITARKRAEARTREDQTQLAGILASAMDAIVSIDEEQRVILFNAAAERMFGCSAADVMGQPIVDFIPARSRAGHDHHVRRFGEANVTTRRMGALGELAALRANGEEFPIEAAISHFALDDRHIYTVIVRDITERQAAEQALRRQARLLNHAHDAILAWELDGTITYWNQGAERTYGYSAGEAIGRISHELLQTSVPEGLAAVRQALSEQGSWEGVVEQRTREGERIVVESRIVVIDDGTGRLALEANRDVTARHAAEDALRTLNEELERRVAERTLQLEAVNRELEAFCSSVSHDLRTPLRGIDGFSQALFEDYGETLDENGRRYLERIRSAAARMSQIIDDLLALSRLSRIELHRQAIDLGEIARSIATDLQERDPERNVEWVIGDDLRAWADPRMVRLALENLLGNAWKFTSRTPAARIEVEAERHGGERVYVVRDNGAGFDMAHAEKLFGIFQRLHTTREFPGTGIGLATVERVIRRHGGRVWAEAAPDQGATFSFMLSPEDAASDEHR